MKTVLALLTGLIISQNVAAAKPEAIQITTANYQDYRSVTTPVTFVAIAKVKPGKVEAFKAIVEELAMVMRTQDGNIYYDLHQSMSDKTEFMFIEEWETGKNMADHMDSAVVGELVTRAGAMFETGFPKFVILKKN